MTTNLTENAISSMLSGSTHIQPCLQIVELEPIQSVQKTTLRYHTAISDGTHKKHIILPKDFNDLVSTGLLQKGSVINVKSWATSAIGPSTSIKLIDFEISTSFAPLIGNPKTLSIPITSNENTPSLSDPQPLSKRNCPLPTTPTSSVLPVQIPIKSLNPYHSNWCIKGYVQRKTALRQFQNQYGLGRVFGFDLFDTEGGEIHITCFNNVADYFFDKIQNENVYIVSKGNVKMANKQYNHLNNDWEILLNTTSTIEHVAGEKKHNPTVRFNIKSINDIKTTIVNSIVDVLGVVTDISGVCTIRRKDGSEVNKQTVQLRDMSEYSIDAIFLGDNFNVVSQEISSLCATGNNPIIAIKSARVGEFNGKNIVTTTRSIILVDPDIEEAHALKLWFKKEGSTAASTSLTTRSPFGHQQKKITISDIYNMDSLEKPTFFQLNDKITKIGMDSFYYISCSSLVGGKKCMKKLIPQNTGMWFCPKCNAEVRDCDYRYLLKIDIQDHTGELASTVTFKDAGSTILGNNAKDFYLLSSDPKLIKEIVSRALWTDHIFTLSVKTETFKELPRLKCVIIKEEKLHFMTKCNNILREIQNISTL
eukprot:PITA_12080